MRGPAASSQVACWVLTPINFWNRLELISSSVADRLKVIFNIKDWWNFFQCLGLVDSKGLNIFNTFLYFFQGLVDSKGQSLDDEYMEDNYGAPLNMVCRQFLNILHILPIQKVSLQVRITHWYVKRYCTENHVSKFVFYFPYILLIVPLTLVLVDRIFIK